MPFYIPARRPLLLSCVDEGVFDGFLGVTGAVEGSMCWELSRILRDLRAEVWLEWDVCKLS